MRVFAWNVRGANRPQVITALTDYIQQYKSIMTIVMDTRMGLEASMLATDPLHLFGRNIIPPPVDTPQAGGVWFLWDRDEVLAELQDSATQTGQSAHFRLTVFNPEATQSPMPVLVSGVYNYPRPSQQDQVWNNLLRFSSCVTSPWLVTGDFNAILHPSEKLGGRSANWSRINKFRTVLASARLED